MVLALAIGVLLMTGLYYALDMHLKATTAGRIQIDQAQVARGVCKKLTQDIKDQLATLDAYPSTKASSTAASSASSSSSNMMSATTTTTPYPFNLGVQGDQDFLAIYISKVPHAVGQAQVSDPTQSGGATTQSSDCDLRRITYWLNTVGDVKGLARQEMIMVTSDDMTTSNLPPIGIDDMTQIVAPEVVAVSFEYFDGMNWQLSWDGTVPGSDGVTPIGPPVAIAITVSVARSDKLDAGPDDPGVRQYRHVVAIPTASFYTNWPNNTSNPTATPQVSTTGG
jgi:hypothetical protein